MLKHYYDEKAPQLFRVANRWHKNWQVPLDPERFEPLVEWQTTIKRFTVDKDSRRGLQDGVKLMDQLARVIYDDTGLKCFNDLHLDLAVDDVG